MGSVSSSASAALTPPPSLIAFTIAASLMMLDFWRYSGVERLTLRSAFIANIAIIGGLLLAATDRLREKARLRLFCHTNILSAL